MAEPIVRIPRWEGIVSEFATLWVLKKGAHKARCALFTHPLGAEVRVTIDGDLWRGELRHDGLALVDLGGECREQSFMAKGWE